MLRTLFTRNLRLHILQIVLILITLSLLLMHFFNRYALDPGEIVVERTQPIIWRTLQKHPAKNVSQEDKTENSEMFCRNSIQGRDLLVDDRGYVCSRESSFSNGCCTNSTSETNSYNCLSCNNITNCCSIYEYCVSCCMNPDNKALLELVLLHTRGRQALVFTAVLDQFELCLVKCRTSSHSVQHENRYRDSDKFCYGLTTVHESEIDVIGGRTLLT